MNTLLMILIILMLISTFLIFMINLISSKSMSNREKFSPFECGFDPKSSNRLPFSLQFFMICIIFLIFDIEITLFLPLILTIKFINMYWYIFLSFSFIMILLIGLYHEWHQNALNWSY